MMRSGCDPKDGISLDQAVQWFTWVWDNYTTNAYFVELQAGERGASGRTMTSRVLCGS